MPPLRGSYGVRMVRIVPWALAHGCYMPPLRGSYIPFNRQRPSPHPTQIPVGDTVQ